MFKKRELILILLIIATSTAFIYYLISINPTITGLVILQENNFDLGIYENTEYATDHIKIISGSSGNYTSQIFDAGKNATWNNITLTFTIKTVEYLFAGGSKDIYSSTDSGETWAQETGDYGGGNIDDITADYLNNLFILEDKKVYKSSDNGKTWAIVNTGFTEYSQKGLKISSDSNNNLFIIDKNGRVFKSADNGETWAEIGDFNGEITNDIKGFDIIKKTTNLTFQIKNCETTDCSDKNFTGPNGTSTAFYTNNSGLNTNSRYFQYKLYFSTEDSSISPKLYNISIGYQKINLAPYNPILNYPKNNSNTTLNHIILNVTATDPDENNLTVYFYGDNSIIKTAAAANGSTLIYNWTNLTDEEHNWSITITNGNLNISSSTLFFTVYLFKDEIEKTPETESSGSSGLRSTTNDIIKKTASETETNTKKTLSENTGLETKNIQKNDEIKEETITKIDLKTKSTGLATLITENITEITKENGISLIFTLIIIATYVVLRIKKRNEKNSNYNIKK